MTCSCNENDLDARALTNRGRVAKTISPVFAVDDRGISPLASAISPGAAWNDERCGVERKPSLGENRPHGDAARALAGRLQSLGNADMAA
jgi:hypothetical protein